MTGDIKTQSKPRESGYQSRTRTNVTQLVRWCGAAGDRTQRLHRLGAILSNNKYIEEPDELQRKVQLNSFAITVGVALIAGVPYSLMFAYHVIPFHADISHLMVVMSLTYGSCNLFGTRRYR